MARFKVGSRVIDDNLETPDETPRHGTVEWVHPATPVCCEWCYDDDSYDVRWDTGEFEECIYDGFLKPEG